MKVLVILAAVLLILPPTGCNKTATTTTPQTLAPGYMNSADQIMGESLAGAHAFYTQIQSDVAAGKYTPSATEKTALDNFATALNVAQSIYIAYHNGQSTEAQAQAAVSTVTTQQTALQATITGGK